MIKLEEEEARDALEVERRRGEVKESTAREVEAREAEREAQQDEKFAHRADDLRAALIRAQSDGLSQNRHPTRRRPVDPFAGGLRAALAPFSTDHSVVESERYLHAAKLSAPAALAALLKDRAVAHYLEDAEHEAVAAVRASEAAAAKAAKAAAKAAKAAAKAAKAASAMAYLEQAEAKAAESAKTDRWVRFVTWMKSNPGSGTNVQRLFNELDADQSGQ